MSKTNLSSRLLMVSGLLLLSALLSTALAARGDQDMEHRLSACVSCHGDHGAGSPDDPSIPHLAGKPEGYLFQQLRSFKSGRRSHPPMEYVVNHLSTSYLRRIAHYFSIQDVPANPHPSPSVSEAILKRGEQLVKHGDPEISVPSCQSCHGEKLTGFEPMMPGILGLSYDYINTQLLRWRSGRRASLGGNCMGVVANRMRRTDLRAVSAWLAQQTPPEDMRPASSEPDNVDLPGWCKLANVSDNDSEER